MVGNTKWLMIEEQLRAFWEAVLADVGLQEKLKTAGRDADAFSAVAKEAGFIISAEEISAVSSDLTEEELLLTRSYRWQKFRQCLIWQKFGH